MLEIKIDNKTQMLEIQIGDKVYKGVIKRSYNISTVKFGLLRRDRDSRYELTTELEIFDGEQQVKGVYSYTPSMAVLHANTIKNIIWRDEEPTWVPTTKDYPVIEFSDINIEVILAAVQQHEKIRSVKINYTAGTK